LCWDHIHEWGIPKTILDWAKKVLSEKWPEFKEKFEDIK
jgi:hypothetical protein